MVRIVSQVMHTRTPDEPIMYYEPLSDKSSTIPPRSSYYTIAGLLCRWRTLRRLVNILPSSSVRILRLLQLHALLLPTEIALIRAAVVALAVITLVCGRRVRWRGVVVTVVLLRRSSGILRWSVAWRWRTGCPARSPPWCLPLTTASTSCENAEGEEEQEGAYDDGGEDNPACMFKCDSRLDCLGYEWLTIDPS